MVAIAVGPVVAVTQVERRYRVRPLGLVVAVRPEEPGRRVRCLAMARLREM